MVRKFLAREWQALLDELGAPDGRTLLWRGALWLCFIATITAMLLGLAWVYSTSGLAAMWAVVFLLILIAMQMERRAPICYSNNWPLSDGGDRLPPPGNNAVRTPSPRRISRSRRPALPGSKK